MFKRTQTHFSYWRGITGLVTLVFMMGLTFLLSASGFSTASSEETDSTQVRQKATDAVTESGVYMDTKKKEFTRTMQQHLDEVAAQIETLKLEAQKKAASGTDHANQTVNDQLAKLEAQRRKMEAQLAKAGNASGKAWDNLRSGVENAWAELRKGVKSASSELNPSNSN